MSTFTLRESGLRKMNNVSFMVCLIWYKVEFGKVALRRVHYVLSVTKGLPNQITVITYFFCYYQSGRCRCEKNGLSFAGCLNRFRVITYQWDIKFFTASMGEVLKLEIA
jgi:hypothetical protein